MVFGNSDLRIKNGEKKLVCNFGAANGCFEDNEFNKSSFLGISEGNEIDVELFEIYKIEPSQKEIA